MPPTLDVSPCRGPFPSSACASAENSPFAFNGKGVSSGGRQPRVFIASAKPPATTLGVYTPTREERRENINNDGSSRGVDNACVDDVTKPAPPPLRKHTQREAAELSSQRKTETPRRKVATVDGAILGAAPGMKSFPLRRPTLSRPLPANTRRRTPPVTPVVSCPSASVSVSSSSSRGSSTPAAATETAMPLDVDHCPPRRTASPATSPSPRQPADMKRPEESENVLVGVAAAPSCAAVTNKASGLQLRSPCEANVVSAKASAPVRISQERNRVLPRDNVLTGNKTALVAASSTAGMEVRRPRLAYAHGKARGAQRVYTTRRPHAGGEGDAGAAAPVGSRVPLCVAQRFPLAEAWPGRHHEPSMELLPPPTTRNAEGPPSRRTSSPSPCMPLTAAEGAEKEYRKGNSDRCGTVEHVVEGRRTTALSVQRVEDMPTGITHSGSGGDGNYRIGSLQPEWVRDASPEKSVPPPQHCLQADAESEMAVRVTPVQRDEEQHAQQQQQEQEQKQPSTQTSLRRHHHPYVVAPQSSPFSTTREPFALASQAPSRYASTTLDTFTWPSSAAATAVSEDRRTTEEASEQSREGRRALVPAHATAPSPTPTPRDLCGDTMARSSSSSCSPSLPVASEPEAVAPRDVLVLAASSPQMTAALPQSRHAQHTKHTKQAQGLSVVQTAPLTSLPPPHRSPQSKKRRPQSPVRTPSPSLLIGVPRILSSTFTSPRMSARGLFGSVSPRQHSAPSSPAVSEQRVPSSTECEEQQQQQQQHSSAAASAHADPQLEVKTADECGDDCGEYRTPLRHWSPEAADMQNQTPVSLPSLEVQRHQPPPQQHQQLYPLPQSPLSTPRRQAQQGEVTTPPPRLSYRARVRSSSRGGRDGLTPPPRVPQTRMQMSPSGSLQVTPRRRAPSSSTLVQ